MDIFDPSPRRTSPPVHLRQVWREVSDGNQGVKVLALQVWREWADGYWEDIPISQDNDDPPE